MTPVLDEEIILLVRRGVCTRHRLCAALPRVPAEEIRHTVARLIFRGRIRPRGQRLFPVEEAQQ